MAREPSNLVPQYLSSRSPEFLFSVAFVFSVNFVGCVSMYRTGKRLAPAIRNVSSDLVEPFFPFSYLGSVGVDESDTQFRVFIQNLPLISLGLFLFICVSHVVKIVSAFYSPIQKRDDIEKRVEKTLKSAAFPSAQCDESTALRDEVGVRFYDPCDSNENKNNVGGGDEGSNDRAISPAEVVESASETSESCSQGNIGENFGMKERKMYYSKKILAPILKYRRSKRRHATGKIVSPVNGKLDSSLKKIPLAPMFFYHVICGLLLVFYVSGPHFIFSLIFFGINYFCISSLSRYLPFSACMTIMWSFMVGSLFCNYYFEGYKFSWLGLPSGWDESPALMSWSIYYNMGILRMIAFNNDLWDAQKANAKKWSDDVYQKHYQTCVGCALMREKNYFSHKKASEAPASGLSSFQKLSKGAEQGNLWSGRGSIVQQAVENTSSKCAPEDTFGSFSLPSVEVNYSKSPYDTTTNSGAGDKYPCTEQGSIVSLPPPVTSIADARDQLCDSVNQQFLSCYKCRTDVPHSVKEYSLLGYLAFLLYPPLLFSGPMISYNAFVSLVSHPSVRFSLKEKIAYGCRVLANMVVLLSLVHYLFLTFFMFSGVKTEDAVSLGFTISSSALNLDENNEDAMIPILDLFSTEAKCYLFYLSLSFLWCKFNVIWKFFRFLAILDGFDIPEDMPYCFTNTVSISDFWQSWHASFNLWIVRYMYIPMGGKKRKALVIIPIFLFIAIWHDIELRLLKWALITCVCFIPELAIITFFRTTTFPLIAEWRQRPVAWRRVRECGATVGQWALITANVVGFSTANKAALSEMRTIFCGGMSKTFLLIFLIFYICSGKISVQHRDRQTYVLECTKERLKRGRILPLKM